MRRLALVTLALAVLAGGAHAQNAQNKPQSAWGDTTPEIGDLPDYLPVDPENTLVIDTAQGAIYVELHPEIAPKAVERIKLLARRGTYDGLQFWRVIPGFVVQADPGNQEGGKTELPNLKPEFTFRLSDAIPHVVVANRAGIEEGFIGALPYVSVSKDAVPKHADGSLYAWGSFCSGVMGMGRDQDRDTANAEIFFMTGPYPGLDRDYTPVGRIVVGGDDLARIAAGEPPAKPDIMKKVSVMADLPEQVPMEVVNPRGELFRDEVAKARQAKGADFSVCDVPIDARFNPSGDQ